MYPSERNSVYPSQRNRQPYLKGRSFGAGPSAYQAAGEIEYVRESVTDFCERGGTLYAHWRKFTPDWNAGRCPRCYNATFGGSTDDECPVCYGVGYEGGYSRPSVQWMVVKDEDSSVERTPLGFFRLSKAESVSPYLPRIFGGDLLGRIVVKNGKYDTQERFVIEGTVRPTRLREDMDVSTKHSEDHLIEDPDVAAHKFYCSMLPEHQDNDKRIIEYFVPFESPIWLGYPGAERDPV